MSGIFPGAPQRSGVTPLTESGGDAAGWDDQQVQIVQATGGGAFSIATLRDTPARISAMSSTGADNATFYFQFPHRWNRGEVRPHLHWAPLANPVATRNVRFSGYYTWWRPGTKLGLLATWTPFTLDLPVLTGEDFDHKVSSIASITPPVGTMESAFLVVHLQRDGSSASDTYTDGGASNLGIIGADAHYQAEKSGTAIEYPGA